MNAKHCKIIVLYSSPFDKLRANGISQRFLKKTPVVTIMNENALNEISADEYSALTRSIMIILDEWGLNASEQLKVLGLPDDTPTRNLNKFRNGKAFPRDDELYKRLEHIVGIYESLRTSYPHNKQMAMLWMQRCNKHFVTRAPITVIREDGLQGLVQVRAHLDCTFDWFSS